jgi:hypothetical protein
MLQPWPRSLVSIHHWQSLLQHCPFWQVLCLLIINAATVTPLSCFPSLLQRSPLCLLFNAAAPLSHFPSLLQQSPLCLLIINAATVTPLSFFPSLLQRSPLCLLTINAATVTPLSRFPSLLSHFPSLLQRSPLCLLIIIQQCFLRRFQCKWLTIVIESRILKPSKSYFQQEIANEACITINQRMRFLYSHFHEDDVNIFHNDVTSFKLSCEIWHRQTFDVWHAP